MTSHSFATITKVFGLNRSRKPSRPPTTRTPKSHLSLFVESTDDLSSPPRSPLTIRSPLRYSKSTSSLFTLVRSRSRKEQVKQNVDRNLPASASSPIRRLKFTLERRSTSSSASSSDTTTYTQYPNTHTANESLPHAALPTLVWPHSLWNTPADGEDVELGLDDEDDHDNGPVFAEFFQRLRDIEAELDLIEARGGSEK